MYLQDRTRPGTFLPAKTYGAGTDPFSIAVSDLNADGKVDIVTANAILNANGTGSSTVSVLLQDPVNAGQFLTAASYATGLSPHHVAIGDLNGDGTPDLAVATGSGVSLLFQDPARPGTFQPQIFVSLDGSPRSVAIADLNADGIADLVVTNAVSVLVMPQNRQAAGTFLAPVSYAAGAQPVHAAIGDLDGDGRPDIAVANAGPLSDPGAASVAVLLQDAITPGTFRVASSYPTALWSQAVAIADLNGDAKLDLAVANSGTLSGPCPPSCGTAGSGVSVLVQDAAAPGQFLASTNYPATGSFVTWVVTADLNGNGKADLIVVEANGVDIRFQDPLRPGQFLTATAIAN